jgi:CBS domain-containing protein
MHLSGQKSKGVVGAYDAAGDGARRALTAIAMTVSEICTYDVVWAEPDATILEAARLMREEHVGCVVVATAVRDKPRPLGVVTDRDIAISVVAAGLDPAVFTVGDVIAREVATVNESDDLFKAVRRMRTQGIRRLPVVDSEGFLKGIFTLDDFVELIGEEIRDAVAIMDREQTREEKTRLAIGQGQ